MNPLLLRFGPYIAAVLAGFMIGWKVQGINVTLAEQATTKVEQEFAQFKIDAEAAAVAQQAKQAKLTKEVNDAIPLYVQALHDYYRRNPVIRMLPPAKRDPRPDAGDPGQPGRGPTDVVLAAGDWRNVERALEQCGETTLLFVQLRDTWRGHLKAKP